MTKEEHDEAAARLRTAFELFEAGCELKRQNLRREFPDADESEIQRHFIAWMRHRPGAEHGDGWGVPIPWPRPNPD